MNDLDILHYFLGIFVEQNQTNDLIVLRQKQYLEYSH